MGNIGKIWKNMETYGKKKIWKITWKIYGKNMGKYMENITWMMIWGPDKLGNVRLTGA